MILRDCSQRSWVKPFSNEDRGVLLEVVGSYHHRCGAQGVAGAFEVVPFDAVEFSDVVADCVIDPVQVGETTGIKPPT